MALTTPILASMNAFDASNEQVFTFSVLSGDQVIANTLTIKDNETLATVYTNRQVTFAFENTVPAGTLTNGKYYQAYVVTENAVGDKSAQSNIIQFYCYTQPTFAFSNIASTGIIGNASYSFDVTYNQTENENLDSYVFNLYNSQEILLSTSGNQYNSSATFPLTLSHLFSGLENNTEYYVEANGITSGGTRITTGRVHIYVQYTQPAFYSNLTLTNHCQGGYITVQANVVGIEGKSNPFPPTYIDEEAVDLSKADTYVKWDDGFEINGDFVLRLWFRGAWNDSVKYPISTAKEYLAKVFTEDVELFNLTNSDGQIIRGGVIYEYASNTAINMYGYIRVFQKSGKSIAYNAISSVLALSADTFVSDDLMLMVKRINNLYTVSLVEKGSAT